jgi:hypothetical protein
MTDPTTDDPASRVDAPDGTASLWVLLAYRWLTDAGLGCDPRHARPCGGGSRSSIAGEARCP